MADVFVYEQGLEVQEGWGDVRRKLPVPIGAGHIFVADFKGDPTSRSLCGVTRSQIGDKTLVKRQRVENLPVCDKCAERWQKVPDGPWDRWVNGKGVRA